MVGYIKISKNVLPHRNVQKNNNNSNNLPLYSISKKHDTIIVSKKILHLQKRIKELYSYIIPRFIKFILGILDVFYVFFLLLIILQLRSLSAISSVTCSCSHSFTCFLALTVEDVFSWISVCLSFISCADWTAVKVGLMRCGRLPCFRVEEPWALQEVLDAWFQQTPLSHNTAQAAGWDACPLVLHLIYIAFCNWW